MSSSSSSILSSSSSSMSSTAPSNKVGYRFLPGTGLKVSDICLGAMTFSTTGKGAWGLPVANQSTSHAILDRFIEVGGNFIDTADAYAESEACIGNWLSSKSNIADFRDSLVLATKVTSMTGMGPNDLGQSKKHILYNVEKSLKSMQTNYIDLYQLHMIDYKTKIEDVARTMNDLVRSGKVRYFGVSNYPAYQLQKLIDYCKYIGIERVISNQSQYSLMCRSPEWELLPQCATEELAFLPWSPLAGGWLSGKFKRGINEPPASSRVQWAESVGWRATDFKSNAQQQTFDIIDEVFKIAEEIKATPAQVSLRWLLQKPQVTSVIIGAKTLEQFEDNVGASFIQLSDDQMKRLDKVSDTPMPYPYSMITTMQSRLGRL